MAVRDIHHKLTYEDYALIPEDGLRHEILDGEHYVSPAPLLEHQDAAGFLYATLYFFVLERGLGRVYIAPVDVRFSEHDIVQPDVFFVSQERSDILRRHDVEGAPDLVIEVLSDSTRRIDEGIKRRLYEEAGVLEYWLIDLLNRIVTIFRRVGNGFGPAKALSADAGDVLTTPLLPGLEIRVSEIFD